MQDRSQLKSLELQARRDFISLWGPRRAEKMKVRETISNTLILLASLQLAVIIMCVSRRFSSQKKEIKVIMTQKVLILALTLCV